MITHYHRMLFQYILGELSIEALAYDQNSQFVRLLLIDRVKSFCYNI